ncbi:MAG: AMP-binding protein, partial [Acidimicrobiales bacterium]|nr:AMP-binding protein [Acidimicrobiales bacterium]
MTHSYLSEISSWAAKRFGARPAFVDPDGSILTYEDLDLRSTKVAAAMNARGVREGSVVGLTLGSYSQWVVAYVAASKLGAAIAAVNPRLTDFERSACLDKVDPALVIESVDDQERLVSEGSATSGFDPAALDEARAAAIVFTSGTTGLPKGAVFTDRQLSAITRYDIGDAVGGDTPIAQYGSTQFAHVGFTTKLPWYLKLGTTTHLLERWKATDVLDLVERERISTIGGVAPQVALLLRDANFDERDLSAVKLLVMGGAMSPPALVEEARRRFGADYSIRWSSTESGGVGTSTAPGAPDSEALYTVGRPRPGMGLEIRDDEGNIVE